MSYLMNHVMDQLRALPLSDLLVILPTYYENEKEYREEEGEIGGLNPMDDEEGFRDAMVDTYHENVADMDDEDKAGAMASLVITLLEMRKG